jgi:hypothetical protein
LEKGRRTVLHTKKKMNLKKKIIVCPVFLNKIKYLGEKNEY